MSRRVAQRITVTVYDDGALSVEGPVEDPAWCVAALANAQDAVRNHHARRAVVVPPHDVAVPAPRVVLP